MKEKLKQFFSKIGVTNFLVFITGFYLAGSILQNIMATKGFSIAGMYITEGGTLISWLVFACMDIITEVWGKKKAIITFCASAFLNLLFTGLFWLCIAIPGNDEYMSECYTTILGSSWRIVIASITAFLIGNYINTWIMHIMKLKSKDSTNKFGFCMRAIISTVAGQLVDNFLFYTLAFAPIGLTPGLETGGWTLVWQFALFTTLLETVVESVFSPLTARFVAFLRNRKEAEEKAVIQENN